MTMATGFYSRGDSKRFVFGIAMGLISTFYMFSGSFPYTEKVTEITPPIQEVGVESNKIEKHDIDLPYSSQDSMKEQNILTGDEISHNDEDTESKLMATKVKILCFFMTSPYYYGNEATHVKKTWGKRCNKMLFFSSIRDYDLPAIPLGTIAGKEMIKPPTSKGILNLRRFRGAFDWFVVANASTFFVLENLRYFLSKQDTKQPIFFGCNNAFVLSRETVNRFINGAHDKGPVCQVSGDLEDTMIQKCFFQLGITHRSMDDSHGMVFACFDRKTGYIANSNKKGYPLTTKIGTVEIELKPMNVSEKAVAFTNLRMTEMYLLEFYIYHLRPYGTNIEFSAS